MGRGMGKDPIRKATAGDLEAVFGLNLQLKLEILQSYWSSRE